MDVCACAGPPVTSDYSPLGSIQTVGGIESYIVGEGERALIVIYDIFGFHNNTKQFCDKMAEGGFTVIMPDFFRGSPWPLDQFPPSDRSELVNWINTAGTWEIVSTDLTNTVEYLRTEKSCSKFGVIGFCWGGRNAMQASSDSTFSACGTAHAAFLSPEYAEACQCPMIFIPSGEDPPTDDIKAILDTKSFGSECVYQRFDDMHHGFCAARGDWTVELQAQRASEAIGMFTTFFNKHLV